MMDLLNCRLLSFAVELDSLVSRFGIFRFDPRLPAIIVISNPGLGLDFETDIGSLHV